MKKIASITFLIFVMIIFFSPYNTANAIFLKNRITAGAGHLIERTILSKDLGYGISNVNKSDPQSAPENFKLFQNYPNPFNPVTTIEYSLSRASYVSLKVYNTLGNEITTLVDEKQEPGIYTAEFDGSGISSGVYYVQMKAGKFVNVKKMILLK